MQTALAKVERLVSKAKAYVAALTIAVPGITTFFANWAQSGVWDTNEWRILLVTVAATILTGGAVYHTPAGLAEVTIVPGSLETPGGQSDPIDALNDPESDDPPPMSPGDPQTPPGLQPDA